MPLGMLLQSQLDHLKPSSETLPRERKMGMNAGQPFISLEELLQRGKCLRKVTPR